MNRFQYIVNGKVQFHSKEEYNTVLIYTLEKDMWDKEDIRSVYDAEKEKFIVGSVQEIKE